MSEHESAIDVLHQECAGRRTEALHICPLSNPCERVEMPFSRWDGLGAAEALDQLMKMRPGVERQEAATTERTEAVSDPREVRMLDLVNAFRAEKLHAADCACRGGWMRDDQCDCWVDPDQQIVLVVNG